MTVVGIPTEMMDMHNSKELYKACQNLRPYKKVFIEMKIKEYLLSGFDGTLGEYCNNQIVTYRAENKGPSILC